jgi:hypothetical protein
MHLQIIDVTNPKTIQSAAQQVVSGWLAAQQHMSPVANVVAHQCLVT